MARTPGVDPSDTRTKLIDAAARAFGESGYEGATVAEIARAAGLTTGAIYSHYANKAELLVDALRVHTERAMEAVVSPEHAHDTTAFVVALANQLLERREGESSLLFEALLASRRDPDVAKILTESFATREEGFVSVLDQGQQNGEIAPDISTAAATRFVLMLGLGSLFMTPLDLPHVPQKEWEDLIRQGLRSFIVGDTND